MSDSVDGEASSRPRDGLQNDLRDAPEDPATLSLFLLYFTRAYQQYILSNIEAFSSPR